MAHKPRANRVTYPDPDSASKFITVSVPSKPSRKATVASRVHPSDAYEAMRKKVEKIAIEVAQLDRDEMRAFFDQLYHKLGVAAAKADSASKKSDPWRWGVRDKIGDFCTY